MKQHPSDIVFVITFCHNIQSHCARRFIPVSDGYDSGNFFTVQNGARIATPLLLALAVIELSDVVFAVDSVPAVGVPPLTHGMATWDAPKTLLPRVPALAVVELSNVLLAVGSVLAVSFHRELHLENVWPARC